MYISRKKRKTDKPSVFLPAAADTEPALQLPETETAQLPSEDAPQQNEPESNAGSNTEDTAEGNTANGETPAPAQQEETPIELIEGEDSEMLEEPPEKPSADLAEFLSQNPATGVLKIQAFIGRQGLPVPGASVTVSKRFENGEKVFYSVINDGDGIADGLILPAPERAASQVPGSDNPYATYSVKAMHPNYLTAVYEKVPIFAGIRSIQPVAFIPRPEAEE